MMKKKSYDVNKEVCNATPLIEVILRSNNYFVLTNSPFGHLPTCEVIVNQMVCKKSSQRENATIFKHY
jgi:hypothetical protein